VLSLSIEIMGFFGSNAGLPEKLNTKADSAKR
jgi:hypothetical protein